MNTAAGTTTVIVLFTKVLKCFKPFYIRHKKGAIMAAYTHWSLY